MKQNLIKLLSELKDKELKDSIPLLWSEAANIKADDPFFYQKLVEQILLSEDKDFIKEPSWARKSIIYNIFPRLSAALNGESGTFLNLIAMLPFIKNLLCDTIYLLPICLIGEDGKVGDLGSIYAPKNLLKIEPTLADKRIKLSVEEQFAAFIEAAHLMNLKVVMEFPLRTASLDSDWIKTNPEWFYWIKKDKAQKFASPYFSKEDLVEIKKIPEKKGKYIPPSKDYIELFSDTPKKESIKIENDKLIGEVNGEKVIVPGAFADWPPDDIQPPWNDISYFKMFEPKDEVERKKWNYLAYNTIRYYDPKLAVDKNRQSELWEKLSDILPYYQKKFSIDGAMIDMGHAIPKPLVEMIIKKARQVDKNFAFFEENFAPSIKSKKTGYDASLGFSWELEAETLYKIMNFSIDAPLPFFAAPETHDSPRAADKKGGENYSKISYAFTAFLPNAIPFVHSGFEIGETIPINTGVGFNKEELDKYRKLKLALFNKAQFDWDRKRDIIDFIVKINRIKLKYDKILIKKNNTKILHCESEASKVLSYRRFDENSNFIVIVNTDTEKAQKFYLDLGFDATSELTDIFTSFIHRPVNNWVSYQLNPLEIILLVDN